MNRTHIAKSVFTVVFLGLALTACGKKADKVPTPAMRPQAGGEVPKDQTIPLPVPSNPNKPELGTWATDCAQDYYQGPQVNYFQSSRTFIVYSETSIVQKFIRYPGTDCGVTAQAQSALVTSRYEWTYRYDKIGVVDGTPWTVIYTTPSGIDVNGTFTITRELAPHLIDVLEFAPDSDGLVYRRIQ